MPQKSKNAWIIGALVILLIVAVWAWMESRDEVDNTLARMQKDLADVRLEVANACGSKNATSPTAKEDCDKALAKLEDFAQKYQRQLADAEQEVENEQQ